MIRLEGVAFGYLPGKPVFRDLCLELRPGRRIGLMGPIGSGKTTLLHIIVGLLRPQAGRVEIFDKERAAEKDFLEVRERIGLLFQDSEDQLFCPTVAEDVAFGPLNLGKTREEAIEIVRRTLAEVGLGGFEERVTHKLSGGEKKLVALATVLAMNPDVLLLDEPTNGLDEASKERIISLLKGLPQARIVISQDRRILARMTDGIWLICEGRIQEKPMERGR